MTSESPSFIFSFTWVKEAVERKAMEFLMTSPAKSTWNIQNKAVSSVLQ